MEKTNNTFQKKNIVILGSGFAGIRCALLLKKHLQKNNKSASYNVILIDKNAYHLYTPALYEIASIPRDEASALTLQHAISIPLEEIVKNKKIFFLQREAVMVNRFTKSIYFSATEALDYYVLVMATGSEINYMNIPNLKEHSHTLKSFKDAILLRNKIESIIKEKREIKIVVGGAGPAGVELIAEFNNYLCYLQEHNLGEQKCDIHLYLVEAADTILPGLDSVLVQKAEKRLRAFGINIHTHSFITEATKTEVVLRDGTRLFFDLFVWMGGVQGAKILETLSIPLTKKRSVAVNVYLQPPEDENIFIIGDSSSFVHQKTGRPVPWTVPVAEGEAAITAKNILRKINKNAMLAFLPFQRYPLVLAVGKKYAIADFIFFKISGILGWIIKEIIDLRYFLSILPFRSALRLWLRNVRLFSSND